MAPNMKKKFLIVISVVVMVFVALSAILMFTLISNQARLMKPPGMVERLSVFLTQNTASTSDNHPFPELRTPFYEIEIERLFRRVKVAGNKLGWNIKHIDDENLKLAFEVVTPVFRFKDEVIVQVIYLNPDKSSLYIQSSSGTGRADFAANSGHIQTLLKTLGKSSRRVKAFQQ